MDHLIPTYDIEARFLISAHDELLHHLVAERDLYRELMDVVLVRLSPRNG